LSNRRLGVALGQVGQRSINSAYGPADTNALQAVRCEASTPNNIVTLRIIGTTTNGKSMKDVAV
jgi:hypothetical protein